jgi:glycosyltransferase involved in cell wall biosynthesis
MITSAVTSSECRTTRGQKNLLLVGNFLSETVGSRHVCEDLAAQLRSAKWNVQTTSAYAPPLARTLDMLHTTWTRRGTYDTVHVDVFAGRAFRWEEAVCWLLRFTGKPFIVTVRDGGFPQFAEQNSRRVRQLLRRASAVTVPSQYLRSQLTPYCDDIVIIPNPLELAKYTFRLRSPANPRLIWLRAFHRVYNPILAAQTTQLLRDEFPDVHLYMIGRDKGDGSQQEFEREVQKVGLTSHVTVVGGVAKHDVPRWMNAGDIFLNTTTVDNTPVSVLEAMACGLCVVTTDVGGIPYMLQHEENALLVCSGDAQAMANSVRRVLTENELAERLSRQARITTELCDWSVVLPRWERLLSRVAHRSVSHQA